MIRNKIKQVCWAIVHFIYSIIKPITPLRILGLFVAKHRLLAYRKYARIKRIYGADCVICTCALLGTGDYYLNGMYLKAWLGKNKITNYVFNVPTPQHLRIINMFDYMSSHTHKVGDNGFLNGFKFFLGNYPIDYHYFFVGTGASYRGFLEMYPYTSFLFGYKGFTMLDCYLRLGFELPADTVRVPAKFSDDTVALDKLIASANAIRGKTILLSPYAVSYDAFSPQFWNIIVWVLKRRGYHLLTNVGKNEQPLKGTKALLVPYEFSVPFLNFAGGFIGIRTGLCDIISTSVCKKVVIHPYYAINWPNGTSLGFTGLKNMGLCDDAVELVLTENNANEREILRAILKEFP
ncbi:hypothetical protein [Desulfitobacterium hafniense]|nr:hypothetical protein [Desulfitobacterium hafniense]